MNERERIRKERKVGVITQHDYKFRLDNDLRPWLDQQINKGRYINNLIRADMTKTLKKPILTD